MPRFFFDFYNGTEEPDADGTVLRDVEEARIEAAKYAAALLDDDPQRFWNGTEWVIRVRDEKGLMLFEIMLLSNDAPALIFTKTPDA